MTINYRTMTLSDYQSVYDLWKSTPGIGLSDADSREGIEKFLKANPGRCFVALEADKLVGAIMCGCDGRRGYLHHLAVRPDLRGQGIGRQLVEECMAALRAIGIDKAHIFVYKHNEVGKVFWRNSGWQERDDLMIMSRDM
ncbi:MAG: GNAT family N-acetyltransferase [Anaerolineaceae bacterium]